MTAVYTHGHHTSVLRSHRWRTAENSAAYLLDHLAPTQRLLDVGCGPGTITADLAARVAAVTAVDTSASVLAEARAFGDDRQLTNVDYQVADVHSLPFDDDTFDVVHAHQVLQHVADPIAALREMRRVCRPGGIVAARDADYEAMTWYPAIPELDEWLDLYRRVARDNHGEPDAGRRLLAWAHEAGFETVTPSADVWCYATPTDREWWSGMWAERITSSGIATTSVDNGHASPADLQRLSQGWQRWGAEADAWFTVLHGEIVAVA
ncbi:class I SAM-dependent methyltransferase [Stackebrandtia nassauensis]|uniref:Methyltransferase type 11 n=1 Tax=Stackebrandtia nassauensis (strain DSM 44728 / CIP 108903 / NRRL B-16338 / NBRC 102104 / LLR-40K-21) TaxID=446470 RepID=D3Q7S8_STANL|nr:class I SAM-dependent methyltransferase [Stackebrandtia nassauensis]ADD44420.1 Methyltransferase type 11 [Stackebrandtia nassauensis DSM 44728]